MTIDEMKRKILSDRELVLNGDFQEREFALQEMPGMATVIVGARRIGKTSLMKRYAAELIRNGVEKERVCYLSFFSSDDLDFKFSLIVDAYYGLYPEFSQDSNVWFFLDEVQVVENWGGGVSYLMEAHPCHVVITGSSARMLSTDIADALRGRCIPLEFYPLSFNEFLSFNGIRHEMKEFYSDDERNMLAKQFLSYMKRSSYPQLYSNDNTELRKLVLNSYYDLTFSRDIIDRYDITRSSMLRALMKRIVKNSGSPYSVRKLVNILDSAGFKTSIALVSSYINMMCDTCFMKEIAIYGTEKEKDRNPRKLYVIDYQMAVLFREFSSANGIILEHIVLAVILRYSHLNVCYYRTKEDFETDFILSDDDNTPKFLIQVTDDYEAAMDREVKSLEAAMGETGLREGIIVSMNTDDVLESKHGTIKVIPAWRFALNASSIFSKGDWLH